MNEKGSCRSELMPHCVTNQLSEGANVYFCTVTYKICKGGVRKVIHVQWVRT